MFVINSQYEAEFRSDNIKATTAGGLEDGLGKVITNIAARSDRSTEDREIYMGGNLILDDLAHLMLDLCKGIKKPHDDEIYNWADLKTHLKEAGIKKQYISSIESIVSGLGYDLDGLTTGRLVKDETEIARFDASSEIDPAMCSTKGPLEHQVQY